MQVPDRRTLLVLLSLVGAMTLASAVLLLLEPRPVAPGGGIELLSTDGRVEPQDVLFDTSPGPIPERWSAIVIHDSGAQHGSARLLNRAHEQLNLGGLGYHFVIGNGTDSPDGQIEIGFRWRRQFIGAHSTGADGPWFNSHAIGICLIGDVDQRAPSQAQLRELVWLVNQLQAKFRVPSSRVYIHTGSDPATGGRLFPLAQFRQQMLTAAVP